MRLRVLIAVLALALSGTNSKLDSMCAAYCTSSGSSGGAAVHHDQLGSHSHRHTANCAECPTGTGNGLNEKCDCSRLGQFQVLKEGSPSFAHTSAVTPIHAVDMPDRALSLTSEDERFSLVKAPNKIRSLNFASASLRI